MRKEIEQLFDDEKGLFLADRYVQGICPKCGAKEQYGDNCEVCGATYEATELIEPVSIFTGNAPSVKKSEHLFFDLESCSKSLKDWINKPIFNQLSKINKRVVYEWFKTLGY